MLKHSKLFDELVKYWLAAVLVFVPLYPKFPFLPIPGTYVSIRVEDFLIAGLGILVLIRILPKLKKLVQDKVVLSVLIFLAVGAVSVISAIFVTKTIVSYIGVLHWIRRIEYFIPLFAGMYIFREDKGKKNLEFFLKVFLVVIYVLFLYGFGQKHFNFPVIITQNEEYSKGIALRWIPGSHINSTFAGHYDLATYMVVVLPLFINLFILLKGVKTKIAVFLAGFAGLWLLVNSASRISLVSYLLAACLSLVFVKRKKAIIPLIIVTIVFSAFSGGLITRYARIFDVAIKKISFSPGIILAQETGTVLEKSKATPIPTSTPSPVFEDRSTSIRLNVEWPRALRGFAKNPLIGTGYSSLTLATDNDFLRLLGEIGILGFSAFMFILVNIGREFRKSLSFLDKFSDIQRAFIAAVVAGSTGVLLNAFFIDVFEASKFAIIFWFLIGYCLYLVRLKLNE